MQNGKGRRVRDERREGQFYDGYRVDDDSILVDPACFLVRAWV